MKKYFGQSFLALVLIGVGMFFLTNSASALAITNPGLPAGPAAGGVSQIFKNILTWLLGIFATLGIVGFVLSGIFYLLAGADEGNAEKGKAGMTWSIVGVIVGLSGYVIMIAVQNMLGGQAAF